jgi:hypothetical protein
MASEAVRLGDLFALLGLSVVTVFAGGCAGNGGSPTSPTPVPLTITVVTISGNSRLTAPGQTSQLTAVATMSDGSTKDITKTVPWRTVHGDVATISQTGLVTAVDFGEAEYDVNSPGNRGPFSIFVLPRGTYILSGQCVQDLSRISDGRSECLADARVEIIGGPMSGRATMTDHGGNWQFIGVTGVLQVKVSKDDYITSIQDVSQPTEAYLMAGICGPGLVPVGGKSIRVTGCI